MYLGYKSLISPSVFVGLTYLCFPRFAGRSLSIRVERGADVHRACPRHVRGVSAHVSADVRGLMGIIKNVAGPAVDTGTELEKMAVWRCWHLPIVLSLTQVNRSHGAMLFRFQVSLGCLNKCSCRT